VQADGSLVEISSSGGLVDFGAILEGSVAVTQNLVVSNTGLQLLDISYWFGPTNTAFTVNGLSGSMIWPGNSETISVTFNVDQLPLGSYVDDGAPGNVHAR